MTGIAFVTRSCVCFEALLLLASPNLNTPGEERAGRGVVVVGTLLNLLTASAAALEKVELAAGVGAGKEVSVVDSDTSFVLTVAMLLLLLLFFFSFSSSCIIISICLGSSTVLLRVDEEEEVNAVEVLIEGLAEGFKKLFDKFS